MPDPIAVVASEIPEFLASAPLAVLLVSVHPAHAFSPALAHQLETDHAAIALGTVDIRDVFTGGGRGLSVLVDAFRRSEAAPGGFALLPGYCLFRGRTMLAWDAGLPDATDFGAIAQGTVLGAICSSVTGDASFLQQALRLAASHAAGARVAARFRAAAARPAAAPGPEPAAGTEDGLVWAYRTLGVATDASDGEIHAAWKRLRIVHHPDRAAGDAAEFGRRSRTSADLNRARDVIMASRARSRQGGAYARAS